MKRVGFTLLELLVSASLLAGLTVILVSTLSSLINSYDVQNATAQSNIQAQLVMQQLKTAIEQATNVQVLAGNSANMQLVLQTQTQNPDGTIIDPTVYQLSLYCLDPTSGLLRWTVQEPSTVPPSLISFSSGKTGLVGCSASGFNIILSYGGFGRVGTITSTNLLDSNTEPINLRITQISTTSDPVSSTPNAWDAYPAYRVQLTTRYLPAKVQERAGHLTSNIPPQLLSEFAEAKNSNLVFSRVIKSGS